MVSDHVSRCLRSSTNTSGEPSTLRPKTENPTLRTLKPRTQTLKNRKPQPLQSATITMHMYPQRIQDASSNMSKSGMVVHQMIWLKAPRHSNDYRNVLGFRGTVLTCTGDDQFSCQQHLIDQPSKGSNLTAWAHTYLPAIAGEHRNDMI